MFIIKRRNQRGFALVGVLLTIILVLIVVVSIYVKTVRTQDNPEIITTTEHKSEIDPTKDWKIYKDPAGFFEFKYPNSWSLPSDMSMCEPGRVMMGANMESTGACESGNTGQMLVQSVKGNLLRSTYEPIAPYFNESEVKWESINVDGVAGLKQIGTVVMPSKIYPGLVAGDKLLVYTFQKDGYTYIARYYLRQQDPFPDVQSDFETMVVKTLKFKQ